MRPLPVLPLVAYVAFACASPPPPEPAAPPEMVAVPVEALPPNTAPIPVAGDCSAIRQMVEAEPDLRVDSLPTPIKQVPPALAHTPTGVIKPNAPAVIQIEVIIDTLGKADMSTFKVLKTTHPWLATNVKSVIGKWTFSPAMLGGCTVRRAYHFSATSVPPPKKG